jgi:hypothetical protein
MAVHRKQISGVPHDNDASGILRPGEDDFTNGHRVHARPGSIALYRVPVFADMEKSRQVPRVFRGVAVPDQEPVPEHATWLADWVAKNQRYGLRCSRLEAERQRGG